jgi:hypothetical protein
MQLKKKPDFRPGFLPFAYQRNGLRKETRTSEASSVTPTSTLEETRNVKSAV